MLFLLRRGDQAAVFVKDHGLYGKAGEFRDLVELRLLGEGADQGEGNALLARPSGAPDAVNVIFVLVRHIVVDHAVNVVNVDAS